MTCILNSKRRVQDLAESDVKSVLEDMHRVSAYYLRLINPTEETDLDIRGSLVQLLTWDVTTSHPLTLKLYAAYADMRVTKDEFIQCLRNVESFVVRRMVCGVPTN